jgi:hypothetical protein
MPNDLPADDTEYAIYGDDGNIAALDMGTEIRLAAVPSARELPDLTGSPLHETAAGRPITVKAATEPHLYQWAGDTWASQRPRSDAEAVAIEWARQRKAAEADRQAGNPTRA